jgi:prepilin-type N-terminal cleavage/methylation domain-containing protein
MDFGWMHVRSSLRKQRLSERNMHTLKRRGFTILEVLVVTAVIAVIFGLLLPVFGQAVDRAKGASELSTMHQLALAASLYHEDTRMWPNSVEQLMEAQRVPKSLAESAMDPTSTGLRNLLVEQLFSNGSKGPRPAVYRSSFVGLGDLNWPEDAIQRLHEEGTNAGWLISFAENRPLNLEDVFQNFKGSYRRLTFEASVVHRNPEWTPVAGAFAGFCFVDMPEEAKRRHAAD